ncbi:MAG: flagellar biosynthesis protein FlhF [Bacillota bacterium]|jgi:flagellar biosynthesis protein FlhF
MLVKRFIGENVVDVMSKIKKELGPEAAILQVRNFKEGGILGFFAKPRVEITAAIEGSTLKPKNKEPEEESELHIKTKTHNELAEMYKMLTELKSNLVQPEEKPKYPKPLQKWHHDLVTKGISEELAGSLIQEIKKELSANEWDEPRVVKEILKKKVTNLCSNIQEIKLNKRPVIIALIGPTGVGKTTTIGKLAAGFSIFEKRNIALITADTYRVAAVEQLKTFGDIIGDPVEVVTDSESLKAAITRHKDKELIFIDTAGRSPHHERHMSELEDFLDLAKPDVTMLVLSVTTNLADQLRIFERFKNVSTHLVLTKLDESLHRGSILDIIVKTNLPVAYLSNGQSIPDNIETASAEKLACYILGEEYHHE